MKKVFKTILKAILFIILLILIVLGILSGILIYTFNAEYSEEKIKEVVEKKRNEVMYTKISDVDEKYIKALIATEDHRFYSHHGIDKIAVLRALKTNFENRKIIEGGSTITQQLLKNMFFNQNVSLDRKVKEALLTVKFEKMYEKDEILEMYINTSYFGSGYYNILEASLGYFGKMPNDLSKTESVFLAGVPNAPAVYDPRVNNKKAHQRRNQVLSKMVDNEVISKKEAEELSKERIITIDPEEGLKNIKRVKEQKQKQTENSESTIDKENIEKINKKNREIIDNIEDVKYKNKNMRREKYELAE